MKIIYQGASAELVEKKSRFIADVAPVHTEAEAAEFINGIKKKYWDCKHHCSAFIIGTNPPITRCTDDGEPAGTAGRPILDMLLGEEITDVCLVVSRYFGGTLLGTGGLVRAYGGAAKLGLEASRVAERRTGRLLHCRLSYDLIGKIQYAAAELRLPDMGSEYGTDVVLSYMVEASLEGQAAADFTERTAGRAILTWEDPASYIIIDGKVILL